MLIVDEEFFKDFIWWQRESSIEIEEQQCHRDKSEAIEVGRGKISMCKTHAMDMEIREQS